MSVLGSIYGGVPGMGTEVDTYEAAITWGPAYQLSWTGGYILASAIDSGNTPTYRLRPGLVMAYVLGQGWTNYDPAGSGGQQLASGVLGYGLRMQDVFTGLTTAKLQPICVGGKVKGANLINLDGQARSDMRLNFQFDDNLPGSPQLPQSFVTKTANYQILSTDNGNEFNNLGAAGEVDFTLPAILPGYTFGFRVLTAQTLKVISAEGGNIVGFNNAARSSLAFSTGGAQIGGYVLLQSNAAGTLWTVTPGSAGANTITYA